MGWWRRMGRGCGQNGIGSTYTNHFTNPHKCVCVLLSEACHVECTWICPRVDVQQIAFGLSQSFAFWRFSLASFCAFVSLCEFVQVGMHCTLEGDPWQCWGRIGFGGSFVPICSNLFFWSTVFEVTWFTASNQNASWCFMGFLEMISGGALQHCLFVDFVLFCRPPGRLIMTLQGWRKLGQMPRQRILCRPPASVHGLHCVGNALLNMYGRYLMISVGRLNTSHLFSEFRLRQVPVLSWPHSHLRAEAGPQWSR